LIYRDIQDAQVVAVSDDRRFATAYNAALQISKMVIACSGYRPPKGSSAHHDSFETVKAAIPTSEIEDLCDYFDICRRKRHNIDYDGSEIVTHTETEEIISKTKEYLTTVEHWIADNHPEFTT
jgi:uncharacterized protein (UPF0332 family)